MQISLFEWLVILLVCVSGLVLFLFLQINRLSLSKSPRNLRRRYESLYNAAASPLWVVDLSRLQTGILRKGIRNFTELESYLDNIADDQLNLRRLFFVKEVNWASVELFQASNKVALLTHIHKQAAINAIPISHVNSRGVRDGVWNVDFQVSFPDCNGATLQLWVNAALPLFQAGFDDVLVTLTDMSDRYRMQKHIEEREGFWEKIVRSVPDLVYVYDREHEQIAYANRHITDLLGQEGPSADKPALNWKQITHPEEQPLFHSARKAVENLDDATVLETKLRMRVNADAGEWRWVHFRNRVLSRDASGNVQSYLGLGKDITDELAYKERLEASERQYRLLAENMTDVVWTTDRNFNITFISPSVENVFGSLVSDLKGRKFYRLFAVENVAMLRRKIRDYLRNFRKAESSSVLSKEVYTFEINATHKNGRAMVLELSLSFLVDTGARILGVMGVCRDVTVRCQADKELKLAAGVFQSSTEAIVITDHQGEVIQINHAFNAITGLNAEKSVKRPIHEVIGLDNLPVVEDLWCQVSDHGFWQSEVTLRRATGEVYPAWMGVTAIHDNQSKLVSHIAIFSDMTESKAHEEVINRLAFYDDLTGLANRTLFNSELSNLVHKAGKANEIFALLYLDLDRFKPVNDSLGHAAGDELLKLVSARIKRCVRDGDLVARMGGDEFTVLVANIVDAASIRRVAANVASKVLREFESPFDIMGRELFVTASVGIAIFSEDGSVSEELLKNADTAMYHAKHKGRNNCQFYLSDMNAQAMERLELENDLRRAVELQQLQLLYQPQVASASGVAVGMEALVRWNHPQRGMLTPDKFIAIAEESSLIVSLGEWVIREACQQLLNWDQAGVYVGRVAVNISARQLRDQGLFECVQSVLAGTGILPERLELEMTESMLMEDVSHVLTVLNKIKKLGVRISIDDFGTGYSSLSYLSQFPLDTLKIDRSFIQSLPGQANDEQIVQAIIAIAHSLSLGVIAEGVETQAQRDFLVSLGCEEIQGFYFARPLQAMSAANMVRNHRAAPQLSEPSSLH
ncbi:MAG: EAL domain-containing protein [Hahellaceae bacterium]|nr:EAL domain-containing protein [Hahellaceae bacterium]MCP5210607.1 EAL domain-containing protein [Hahellaceae bacterium]